MKAKLNILVASVIIIATVTSCKKELPTYGINNEHVNLNSIDKNSLKKQTEFISQAYADLFGKPINSNALEETKVCFNAFSDKEMIEDMIIRDMLRSAKYSIPERIEIESNVDSFTVSVYKRFYHRSPNELELWNIRNIIQTDTSVGPEMIYYAVMTSDEYKFY